METGALKIRYCRVCRKDKEEKGFAPSEANGSYGKCKDCTKAFKLKKRYGITQEQYDQMSSSQNDTCAICPKSKIHKNKKLSVDHNHKTGKIRGLLCDNCNRALGFLEADNGVSLFEKAIDYIKSHS